MAPLATESAKTNTQPRRPRVNKKTPNHGHQHDNPNGCVPSPSLELSSTEAVGTPAVCLPGSCPTMGHSRKWTTTTAAAGRAKAGPEWPTPCLRKSWGQKRGGGKRKRRVLSRPNVVIITDRGFPKLLINVPAQVTRLTTTCTSVIQPPRFLGLYTRPNTTTTHPHTCRSY